MAELPKIAPKVQELYLGAALYDLGERGWGPVAALARVHPLSKIYLGSNDIGDVGVAALVAAVAGSPALQLLELADNGIDDDGAMVLCTLLDPGKGCTIRSNHSCYV